MFLMAENVPAFIAKLWHMLHDKLTDDMICWSEDGTSFIIKDQIRFAQELLPKYYKHNNMASFIRQLNMYGFHKLLSVESTSMKNEGCELGFSHQYFVAGQPFLLDKIKRKITSGREMIGNLKDDPKLIEKLLLEVKQLQNRQELFDSKLSAMKNENDALWREHSILRQKHAKQQKIVNKVIQFLVTLVQQTRGMNVKRLPLPLMIKDGGNTTTDPVCVISENMVGSPTGPIICEVDPCDFSTEEGGLHGMNKGETFLITMPNQDVNNSFNQHPASKDDLTVPLLEASQSIMQKIKVKPSETMNTSKSSSSNVLCTGKSKKSRKRKHCSSFDEDDVLNTPKIPAVFLDEPNFNADLGITSPLMGDRIVLPDDGEFPCIDRTTENVLPSVCILKDENDISSELTATLSSLTNLSETFPSGHSEKEEPVKNNSDGLVGKEEMSLVPAGASSNEPSQLNLSLRTDEENHLEVMQSDFDFLKDILKGEGLNLDASTLFELFSEDPVSLNMTSNSEDQNMEDLTGTGSELVAYPQLFLDDGDTEKQSCGIDSSGNTSQTRTENSIPVLDSLVPKDS